MIRHGEKGTKDKELKLLEFLERADEIQNINTRSFAKIVKATSCSKDRKIAQWQRERKKAYFENWL